MREGWEFKKLGEACKVERGSSPRPIRNFVTDDDDGVNWIKIGDVGENDKYVVQTKQKITKKGAQKSRFVDVGDFILSNSMSFGRPYIMKIQGYIHDGWFVLRLYENLDSNYFWYLLSSPLLSEQFKDLAAGAIVKNISGDLVKKAKIPIPPLEEQKQIVTILDEAFTAIDQAKANIEKNITNAKELFQSKLNDIFSQKGNGWEEKKLIEICDVKDGTHDSPKYVDEKDGIPFVTQKNILENGISFENTKFISKYDHNHFYKRSNVAYNDILFAMIGANRGMACIVDDKRVFSIKNVGLIKSNENYRAKFILYFFKSPIAKKYVAENSSGSAQGFIGLTKLRAFTIPYTNIENQRRIELQIESLNDAINTSIFNYNLKLNSFEELKKSILQKAFAGELTQKEVLV